MRAILASDTPEVVAAGRPKGRPAASPVVAPSPGTPLGEADFVDSPDSASSSRFAYMDTTVDDSTVDVARALRHGAGLPPTPVAAGVLRDMPPPPPQAAPRSAAANEVHASLEKDGQAIKLFNPSFVSKLFASFTPMRVTREATAVLMDTTHKYFAQVSEDLARIVTEGKRSRIDTADMENLFVRCVR